jgi:NADH:ubiquinone oxidoreductase subunit 3 (subunit A)
VVAEGIPELVYYLGFITVNTLALVVVLILLVSPRDKRPTPEKRAAFESGQIAAGRGRTRFIIQYYPYLLMFVVYDVVAMFLFAWALNLRALGAAGTVPVLIFVSVLLVPLGYALHLANRPENW